jgi:hypothetical protein
MPTVRSRDIDALVVGVSLLGSGGGGDAWACGQVLRRRLGDGEITLHPLAELGDTPTMPVGVAGATSVFAEKLPSGNEFARVSTAMARWTGRQPGAVMALEAGGLNGVAALVAALDLGLPFADADLMGRALPRLDQFTWAALGQSIMPCVMCEPSGQTVVVDDTDPAGLERTVRAFVSQAGGWAAMALPPRPARDGEDNACTGSLSRALRLGQAHASLRRPPSSAEVAHTLGGRTLGDGRVLEIDRHGPASTFGRGSVTVIGQSGEVLRLETENEYLLAMIDGEVVATTPDLLCVLDRQTARPLSVERLRVGDEVFVVVLPGPSWWRRKDRLAAVGPAAFGLDCPPVLLEPA